MASKVFLDANVLLDFTLRRADHKPSRKILELVVTGSIKAFVTPAIIHIVGYWLAKCYGSKLARQLLLTILMDVTVIDLPHELVVTALHSKMDDVEDALQYYTAVHHKLDFFVSRDKQLRKQCIPLLPVCTPEELVNELLADS